MDKMQANGIRVILDIPGLPAPIWLHRAHPGVDIVAQNGTRLPPAERYMDNISDPAHFANTPDHSPAITINRFGKGNALYLATESNDSTIGPVLQRVLRLAGIQAGPSTPEGVYARSVDGRTLYVNTTEEKKTVPLEVSKRGMLTNRIYEGAMVLDPLASDLVQ
jgi:beta-galactosidase GanA